MREAEKLKRLRLAFRSDPSTIGGEPAELDQTGLVGMQLQPEPREPAAKIGLKPPRVPPVLEAHHEVSRRRESHPPALAEPGVNLSAHRAPIVQPSGRTPKRQWANRPGWRRATSAINLRALPGRRRSRLYFFMAHRTRMSLRWRKTGYNMDL